MYRVARRRLVTSPASHSLSLRHSLTVSCKEVDKQTQTVSVTSCPLLTVSKSWNPSPGLGCLHSFLAPRCVRESRRTDAEGQHWVPPGMEPVRLPGRQAGGVCEAPGEGRKEAAASSEPAGQTLWSGRKES